MQVLLADQLGPHFQVAKDLVLPEVISQFSKRRYHRKKAHLILSAIRHRALDPGVSLIKLDSYRDLVGASEVIHPTSREFFAWAKRLGLEVLPSRGFVASFEEFQSWVASKAGKRLVMEDFYRQQRTRTGLLMDGTAPAGGKWNFDSDNRLPPSKSGSHFPEPFFPEEDEIDEQVRWDLNQLEKSGKAQFSGIDGPRAFAATRTEALMALERFIDTRLATFGPYEDAVDENSWVMSHSLLSVPMNLGLLDPLEVANAADIAYQSGRIPLSSAEGFIRQIIGWRDYVWHLYWHFGEDYLDRNELNAKRPLPASWLDLDGSKSKARCVSSTLGVVSEQSWTHHIPRLMILGNTALQQGYEPKSVNDWFIDNFADGYKWVMPANVIGMSLYADGGMMSTKPYAAGGSYISKMTTHCKSCEFDPKVRTGPNACPLTNGYWQLLDRNRERFEKNQRMSQAMAGLKRLTDRAELNQINFEDYGF